MGRKHPGRSGIAALALLAFLAGALPARAEDPVLAAADAAAVRLKARVGLAIRDTGSGRTWLRSADARFPMASTFKALACAALLAEGRTEQTVRLTRAELLPHSPVTERRVGEEMTLGDLCAATLATSDNAAANRVLAAIGGPAGLTAFLRGLGDTTTRLDRTEPTLNEGRPGDPRDTTTPAAMMRTLETLALGNGLSAPERAQLVDWMRDNAVAGALLRAGLPGDWQVADRSGAGGAGSRGIIAVLWPPGRAPLVAAIYITGTSASLEARDAAIADIGRALAASLPPP